ncbi:MAG: LamG domain-containing protein [Anaerolineales bacterium]|nr:LamG domain-containing protein [Anaerolineales bacterium]
MAHRLLSLQPAAPNFTRRLLNAYPAALIGAWVLDEGAGAAVAVDASGNGYNGTYTGVAAGADRAPDGRPAPRFGGEGAVIVPDDAALTPAAFTLAFWLRLAAHAPYGGIIGKNEASWSEAGYAFAFAGGYLGWLNSYTESGVSRLDPALNRWQHWALSYDGEFVRLYRGGVLAAVRAYSTPITPAAVPLTFGRTPGAADMRGSLARVGLWGAALTAAQIAALAADAL